MSAENASEMSGPLLYIDTSKVREGALEELKGAVDELVGFIDANVPQVLTYNVYLNDDGTEMTIAHLHSDSASLERHLEVGAPVFRKLADLITLSSIHVYGQPSGRALRQLQDKAQSLGSGKVIIHDVHAGFSRLGTP